MKDPDSLNAPLSPEHQEAIRKSRVLDAVVFLAAAVGFVVIGILIKIVHNWANTESLANNSMDLLPPFLVLTGVFLFWFAIIKLLRSQN